MLSLAGGVAGAVGATKTRELSPGRYRVTVSAPALIHDGNNEVALEGDLIVNPGTPLEVELVESSFSMAAATGAPVRAWLSPLESGA